MYRRLLEALKLVKPLKPHLPQTNVSGSVCNYCKGKGKIFHWEFGQFVECGCCLQTDR